MAENPTQNPPGQRAGVARLDEAEAITSHFEWIARCLASATAERSLLPAVNAIRGILLALDHGDRATARPEAVDQVRSALAPASVAIAELVAPILADRVSTGLGHVRSLLDLFGRDEQELVDERAWREIQDHIDRSALIADELDAVHRRREIDAREAWRPAAAQSIH